MSDVPRTPMWKGRKLSDLTREELIDAVTELGDILLLRMKHDAEHAEMMAKEFEELAKTRAAFWLSYNEMETKINAKP